MKRYVCVAAILAGPAAFAQQQPAQVEDVFIQRVGPPPGAVAGAPAIGFMAAPSADMHFISSEFSWEANTVKDAPYSADAVTETVQMLADGNRIARKNTSQVWRDSQGRTRREETLDGVGPWASGQPHKMIFINDPVAGVNYVLNPQTKTAEKIEIGKPHTMPLPAERGAVRKMMTVRGEFTQALPAPPPMGAVTGGIMAYRADRVMHAQPAGNENVTNTPLGKQIIEGITAEGTRNVFTIPAGQIGNDRQIEVVGEHWRSPELQTVVFSKRSDPRFGETTFKLTGIQRTEPARSLFEVPAEYQMQDGGAMRLEFKKFEKKIEDE